MQTLMTLCHLIPMWYEWNANTDDMMMIWFALYANLMMSHLACAMCAMCMVHILYVETACLSSQVARHACKPT